MRNCKKKKKKKAAEGKSIGENPSPSKPTLEQLRQLAVLLTLPSPKLFKNRFASLVSSILQRALFIVPFSAFQLLGPFFKKTVADYNAPVQEKALDALIAYLRAADADAGRYAKEVCDAIVAKCLRGRPKTAESSGIFYALDRIGSSGCISGIFRWNVLL
ncbi:hypothetical protein K1719_039536 [Acacia pycnantha]|nr:hypothetical protein K1719_039536 [Acacia pycnantha]